MAVQHSSALTIEGSTYNSKSVLVTCVQQWCSQSQLSCKGSAALMTSCLLLSQCV